MRRSKAPSVINKAKRLCNTKDHINDSQVENHSSDPEDEQYNWGSGSHNNGELQQNRYNKNRRIFNIVWRDVSTKKYKTWKGDGTLEVNQILLKAFLKDETGKYIGCSKKFKMNDLAPDFQMVVGGKEIEIQNEILNEDELLELSKRQVQNRNWRKEEWIPPKDMTEKEKKPKGGFKFKPILVLNSPEVPLNKDQLLKNLGNVTSNSVTDEIQEPTSSIDPNMLNKSNLMNSKRNSELICFVKQSELQQFLCQKVLEYCSSIKTKMNLDKLQSLDIKNVLQHICNHPSFINHKTATNELIRHVIPFLPVWSEMGPFDSGKLEFVQYFLTNLTKLNPQTCTIFAKHLNVLNMLHGLCDFMNIKCLRISSMHLEGMNAQDVTKFCSSENKSTKVIIVDAVEMLKNYNIFTYCKKLIIFEEYSENILNILTTENVRDITIYNLVTAFSIEEFLLFNTYNNDNIYNLIDELVNISNTDMNCCYLHSKTQCNCLNSYKEFIHTTNLIVGNWEHFKHPFDEQLLKVFNINVFYYEEI